jgi:hypothetical protein
MKTDSRKITNKIIVKVAVSTVYKGKEMAEGVPPFQQFHPLGPFPARPFGEQ